MTDRELMQMALDALEKHVLEYETIEALRARLSQCERCGEVNPAEIHTCTPQEPVGWLMKPKEDLPEHEWLKSHVVEKIPEDWNGYHAVPLYTAPPQRQQRTYTLRKWQGLTDEEVVDRANAEVFAGAFARGVAWAELKLKEKNNG